MDYLDALGKIDDFERRNLPAYKNVRRHPYMLPPFEAAQQRENDHAQLPQPRLKAFPSLGSAQEVAMPTSIYLHFLNDMNVGISTIGRDAN